MFLKKFFALAFALAFALVCLSTPGIAAAQTTLVTVNFEVEIWGPNPNYTTTVDDTGLIETDSVFVADQQIPSNLLPYLPTTMNPITVDIGVVSKEDAPLAVAVAIIVNLISGWQQVNDTEDDFEEIVEALGEVFDNFTGWLSGI